MRSDKPRPEKIRPHKGKYHGCEKSGRPGGPTFPEGSVSYTFHDKRQRQRPTTTTNDNDDDNDDDNDNDNDKDKCPRTWKEAHTGFDSCTPPQAKISKRQDQVRPL